MRLSEVTLTLAGIPLTFTRVEGCRRGIVKPGPCPGPRKPRPARRVRAFSPATATKPKAAPTQRALADVFARAPLSMELPPQLDAPVRQAFTGTFGGGLTARPGKISRGAGGELAVLGDILTSDGTRVGGFYWVLTREPGGRMIASHRFVQLPQRLQGQGFASGFNRQLYAWYRTNGVAKVRLHANIDVGGWAWARAGYDWATPDAAHGVADRIDETVRLLDGGEQDEEFEGFAPDVGKIPVREQSGQRALALEMARRLREEKFGSPGYPTPYEVSELGRWGGQDPRSGVWHVGQVIMMGSEWDGETDP